MAEPGPRPITVRRASLAEIIALRHGELRPGRPRRDAEFDGDGDPSTWHFVAFLAGAAEPVGCASFMARAWRGEPAHQLRGMATRADLVRRDVGRRLLHHAERTLGEEADADILWCNARLAAVPFYERLGWTVVSARFDVPDVGPHRAMVRRVSISP